MWRSPHRPHGPAFLERCLDFEEVSQHRHVSCGLYNLCLFLAVRRHWPSFTCIPCSLWPSGRGLPSDSGPATVLTMPVADNR
jgi:hypothetical protein